MSSRYFTLSSPQVKLPFEKEKIKFFSPPMSEIDPHCSRKEFKRQEAVAMGFNDSLFSQYPVL